MRRIQRDVAVRGRDVHGVIEQYTRFVKPAFDQFVAPSRKHAEGRTSPVNVLQTPRAMCFFEKS